jgi:hypothetical protein
MRAVAIPTVLGGVIAIWAYLAPVSKENSDPRLSGGVTAPIVIAESDAGAQMEADSENGLPTPESESPVLKAYIDLQCAEVSAIAKQIDVVRQESAVVVNDLLGRRQANSTLTWRGRISELKTAQSLTDQRFQEWQDRDLELQQAIERFEHLSKSLPTEEEYPGDAASLIGKAALQCETLSENYREAGTLWSQAVQSECQLTKAGKHSSTPNETDAKIELHSPTTKSAAVLGQQAMRYAECGERKMDSHQDTVRFTRRVRTLKVVGPLHTVDRLSIANQQLYADVRQVANSLTRDPDISSERLAFLKNKLKTLMGQIAKNTSDLDAASKEVKIFYPCAGGSCSR